MKLIPFGDKVIVEVIDDALKTRKSGLIVVKTTEDKAPQTGTVVRKGPDCGKGIKVGDIVIFEKYSGDEFNDPDTNKRYLIMEEEAIIATYNEENQRQG